MTREELLWLVDNVVKGHNTSIIESTVCYRSSNGCLHAIYPMTTKKGLFDNQSFPNHILQPKPVTKSIRAQNTPPFDIVDYDLGKLAFWHQSQYCW